MSNLLNRFDVAKLIGRTDRTAFKLIKHLNNELEQNGKIIFPGRIDRDYFFERCAISETSHWISCTDQLPKLVNDVKDGYTDVELWLESDPVLVYSDSSERIQIAILSAFDTLDEKNWINVENLETITCVSHWMPLPNRPEEV